MRLVHICSGGCGDQQAPGPNNCTSEPASTKSAHARDASCNSCCLSLLCCQQCRPRKRGRPSNSSLCNARYFATRYIAIRIAVCTSVNRCVNFDILMDCALHHSYPSIYYLAGGVRLSWVLSSCSGDCKGLEEYHIGFWEPGKRGAQPGGPSSHRPGQVP